MICLRKWNLITYIVTVYIVTSKIDLSGINLHAMFNIVVLKFLETFMLILEEKHVEN